MQILLDYLLKFLYILIDYSIILCGPFLIFLFIPLMNLYLEYLKYLGIQMDSPLPPLVNLSLIFLILSVISLLSVINISIYLLSIYMLSDERILSKIPSKYVYIHKILKYYKNIRMFYILLEVIVLLFSICVIIYLNYILVSPYIHIN